MLFSAAVESDKPLKVLSQNSRQIRLSFTSPDLELKNYDGNFKRLEMAGCEFTAQSGYPELPMFNAWIAIPPQGDFTITVNHTQPSIRSNVTPKPVYATEEHERASNYNRAAYASSTAYPARRYEYSQPQIMRDFRVVQISLFPVQYNAATGELEIVSDFDIQIDISNNPGVNELPAYTSYSSAFTKIYESMIINFDYYRDVLSAPPGARILLIYGNNTDNVFQTKLAEFVAWKRQKGFEVNFVSTSQTGGSSNTAIKNYIQTQYNNASTRPDFIILLGDTAGSYTIPAFVENMSSYAGEGDYPYTHLAGNDLLGDAFIGRLSAENISQLDVLFAKIYAVEKNINLSGTSASWLNRILLVGDPTSSGISTRYINKFIKELSRKVNPSYSYLETYDTGFANAINSGINQGVGFFNYRGFINMSNWDPSSSMVNGTKLSHATILTCGTGDYMGDTATSEALMRWGTAASPAGSVTAIGMSTTGTHTMFNNCLVAGIYDGLFTYNMRTMGEALLNGRLYIKQVYGSTLDNQANYFAHWCNLMGDPTVETFVGIPGEFTMLAPDSLALGSNLVDVNIINNLGLPVEGACVTAYSSSLTAVVGRAFTDAEGNASVTISGGMIHNLLLTVSKHDYKPLQHNLPVDNFGSIVFQSQIILDNGEAGSSGNSDGYANAGETIAINLNLKNTTSSGISASTAVLSSNDPYITIINAQNSFNAVDSGASVFGNSSFTFSIATNLPPQHDIRCSVLISDSESNFYSLVFHVTSYNARLMVQNYTVTGGGNNILDPAENGFVTMGIKNNSISAISDIYAQIYALNDLLLVTDSLSYVGSIPAGAVATTVDGFEVFARALLIPGMQMPVRVRLYNSSGFEQFAVFNISIGQVSQNTPLGPDAYGYFIYDVTDTNYTDCPVYEWIEINPADGGSGTLIPGFNDAGTPNDEGDQNGAVALQTVNLPFAFPFYGVSYNQITVCVNGFIAMGITENGEFRNYHVPGGYGPSPMIAAFWDDLIIISDAGIYKYYDAANHKFIIQYHKMRNGYNRSSLETFQVIFYDPLYYPTSMGDGMIKIQYKDFNNVDVGGGGYTPLHGNFSTIGIKDHTNTIGLEYSYNNQYPYAAAPLSSQKALLITTAPVLHENAFLVLDNVIINDNNENGLAEPGETLELGIKLMNLGINTAQNVQLNCSTLSEQANLINSTSVYSNIPGDTSAVNNTAITLQINLDCPEGTVILVNCVVTIAGNSWQYPISIAVKKPSLSVSGLYMNDCNANGNGNGLIDPGESLKLIVNYTNNSPLEAKNITSNIMCLSEFVTINNPSQLLPGVPAGGTCQAVYYVDISPNVIIGNNITFYLTYLGDLIDPQNEQLVLSIGTTGMNEDFESDNGDFIANPSYNGWEWGSSSVAGAHSGTNVWGTRLNSQYPANVTYMLTTPSVFIGTNFMLEFWHRFNTEATYDGGNVKISTDNGSTWNLISPEGGYTSASLSILGGPGYDGNSGSWIPARFNLGPYATQNVKFRFTFASDGLYQDYGWYLDDVRTTGYIEFAGMVTGTVTSSNLAIDYTQVAVHNVDNWAARPDSGGLYALYLPVGAHQIAASALGYNSPPSVGISLSLNNPLSNQDFYLGYFAPATSLGYNVSEGVITLNWTPPVEPEYAITGFDVFRKVNAGAFEQVAHVYEPHYSETLAVYGTTYVFYVVCTYAAGNSLPTGHLLYTHSVDGEDDHNPVLVTKLMQNYPNPFNPTTTIRFSIKERASTQLCIYNLKGQLVKTLVSEVLPEGLHQILWNGKDSNNRNVASGMYFYRLESGNYSFSKKMLLLK